MGYVFDKLPFQTSIFKYFIFIYVRVHACMCVGLCMCAGEPAGQKGKLDTLELELQVVLGAEVWPYKKTVHVP